MIKIKLNNQKEFNLLIDELKEDEEASIHFENEPKPNSFPCIAIHNYAYNSDFGSSYQIAFVYPSDFIASLLFLNN